MSFLKVSDNNNDPTQQASSRSSESTDSTDLKARVEPEGGAGASAVREHRKALPRQRFKMTDLIAAAHRDQEHDIIEKNAIIDCTDCTAFIVNQP